MNNADRFYDTYKLKGLREAQIEAIHAKMPLTDALYQAFLNTPRHYFVDSALAEQSYGVSPIRIFGGQTISQPFTVAYQTMLLEVKPNQNILEIGTGSGYQCGILCTLGAQVFSIERIEGLSKLAHESLSHLKLNPQLFVGDGSLGLPHHAPFDKIIITCAAPLVPEPLLAQLSPNYGIMVAPIGDKDIQTMKRYIKLPTGEVKEEVYDDFKFVPMLGKHGF